MEIGFNDDFAALQAGGFGASVGSKYARFPIADDANAMPAYEAALAAGVKPIIGAAGWSTGPASAEEYAAKMADLARRFPQAVYQLWNEPNLGTGPGTGANHPGGLSAQQAAQFATAAAQAIRGVNPNARIIGPSVAPIKMLGWKNYFNEMYSQIPRGLMETGLNLYPLGKNRIKQVKRAARMASQYGPVTVTELDMSAPWMTQNPDDPQATRRALLALQRAGVGTVLLNGLENHQPEFAAIQAALLRRREEQGRRRRGERNRAPSRARPIP